MHSGHATSFGRASRDYAQGRPTYPPDAVRWMVGQSPADVLDMGAGTGKLTEVLVGLGHHVVACDPDPAMLAELRGAVPWVTTVEGRAESVPVASGSADAVVVGQAWHWVDPVPASAEAGRVVRPGGTLGLIWNVRDERVPWVRALTEAMHGSAAERLIATDGPRVASPFGALESRTWEWIRTMTRADVRAMVRSRSYYIASDDEGKRVIDAAVSTVLDGLDGDAVDMPYVTHAFRARRNG